MASRSYALGGFREAQRLPEIRSNSENFGVCGLQSHRFQRISIGVCQF